MRIAVFPAPGFGRAHREMLIGAVGVNQTYASSECKHDRA
jgi:hypothetical protein